MMKSRRFSRVSVLLAACALLSLFIPMGLAEQPALPAQAVVKSPISAAAHLCNYADDYNTPQAIYFNGTSLEVIEMVPAHGAFPPELLQFGDERWARVRIGKTDSFGGIEGFMPLSVLSFDQDMSAAFPAASLDGKEDMVALYQDNGLGEGLVGEYPKGTQVSLLGWLLDWAHVAVDGKTGFVRQDALLLDTAATETLFAALPPSFDEIQPGHQAQYALYMDELMKLYAAHGDSNEWPLAIKVEATELAARYGFRYTTDINLMPEESDLSEEAVLKAAKAAAFEFFGIAEDSWNHGSLSFSYPEGDPEAIGWKVNLWSHPGGHDAVIWLNRQGEVTGSLLNDMIAVEPDASPTPEEMAEMTSQVEYYLYGQNAEPEEGVLSQSQAEDMAWDKLLGIYEAGDRSTYRFESRYLRNDENTQSWWLVSINPPLPEEWAIRFDAAIMAPLGEVSYITDAKLFGENMAWAARQQELLALEQERGPYSTWTLEQKAAWDPEYYGLPNPDEVPMAQAITTARERLNSSYGLEESALSALDEAVYFDILDNRLWRITYSTKGEYMEGEDWTFYSVTIDAKTGEVLDVLGPSPVG